MAVAAQSGLWQAANSCLTLATTLTFKWHDNPISIFISLHLNSRERLVSEVWLLGKKGTSATSERCGASLSSKLDRRVLAGEGEAPNASRPTCFSPLRQSVRQARAPSRGELQGKSRRPAQLTPAAFPSPRVSHTAHTRGLEGRLAGWRRRTGPTSSPPAGSSASSRS